MYWSVVQDPDTVFIAFIVFTGLRGLRWRGQSPLRPGLHRKKREIFETGLAFSKKWVYISEPFAQRELKNLPERRQLIEKLQKKFGSRLDKPVSRVYIKRRSHAMGDDRG